MRRERKKERETPLSSLLAFPLMKGPKNPRGEEEDSVLEIHLRSGVVLH